MTILFRHSLYMYSPSRKSSPSSKHCSKCQSFLVNVENREFLRTFRSIQIERKYDTINTIKIQYKFRSIQIRTIPVFPTWTKTHSIA